ncbi:MULTISPECIES: ABC transporter substrate-binding protein [unclassified Variovorax]|uniref:ABC transporter substrate-binding protein n=1 Tax=unclassified Variovorax TaxID=663243 RepID=UPI001BD518D3|nr:MULTISPECIES: ABC transporter substrate-binding protein [unclassified Variovorax]
MLNFKTTVVAAVMAICAATLMPAHAQAPIKIGYLGTFSGPIGAIGQDNYDGFMLGIEQRGGKLGNVPVQVLKEDDQFKPDVGLQIAQKFIEKEQTPIIVGVIGSNVMMAIQRPITEKQVFLIGTNAGPSAMAGAQCSPYQFIVSWQNDLHAEAAGKYANDKGFKRMVLIAPNYQAGKDALQGFKRQFKGTVLDELLPGMSQPDFSAEIAQIAAAKPDAVYAFFPGALAVNFVRQYQQAGLNKTIPLQSSAMLDATTLPALKDAALGLVTTHYWGPDLPNPVNREFVDAFEKKYNRIPSLFAAQGYDAALLLDTAIGKVKGNVADKPALQAALKAGIPKSTRGELKFGNNNFPINDWYALEVAKDGKGRISLKTIATPLKDYQDSYHAQCAMK